MAQLRIDKTETSKSGKSIVITAGGKKYFAKPEQNLLGKDGSTIEAKTTISEYQGNEMVWINEWSEVEGAPKPPVGTKPSAAADMLRQAPYWQPFGSNVVAAAIAAGLIKEPPQIRAWVFAVRGAMEEVLDNDVPY
jgi:hypothetical protein